MSHGIFHYCVWNETLTKVMITLQETISPRTHSRRSNVLIPHPRDQREEETAAGTGNQGRMSQKASMIRRGWQRWKMNKTQQGCSLSIRRISLLRPPAAGGEHLPSHSQTTLASTLPSGESNSISITVCYSSIWRAAHQCLCVLLHRIEFSTVQRETYPGWPIVNPRCAGRLRAASSGQPNMASEW